jgi:hypothetical protein
MAELRPQELAGVEVLIGALAWPTYVDGVSISRTRSSS